MSLAYSYAFFFRELQTREHDCIGKLPRQRDKELGSRLVHRLVAASFFITLSNELFTLSVEYRRLKGAMLLSEN